MAIKIDAIRGKKVAKLLYDAFQKEGIFGETSMPEDIVPSGMKRGSLEHILFITLTVSIDYQREAGSLWNSSRRTFEDSNLKYLYSPQLLHEANFGKIVEDMKKYNLSKKPVEDAETWKTLGTTFYRNWGGDPRNFLEDCGWDSMTILDRLKSDAYKKGNRKMLHFRFLGGPKIGPLWLRMLRDNVGITQLGSLEKVPIPVDVHVARATLAMGVVRGKERYGLKEIFNT